MPRGLAFMLGAVPHWIYERDPMQSLRFEKPLAELKSQLAKKDGRPTGPRPPAAVALPKGVRCISRNLMLPEIQRLQPTLVSSELGKPETARKTESCSRPEPARSPESGGEREAPSLVQRHPEHPTR